MSHITTHILDTSKGRPAAGVNVFVYQQIGEEWKQLALGHTNSDGRIPELLPAGITLEPDTYKLRFETSDYFEKQGLQSFYPFVEITFTITGPEHYHVPLLLNPFGYSTYRGS